MFKTIRLAGTFLIATSAMSVAQAADESTQFDLVCDLEGRVVANPNNISNGAGPADVTHWVYKPRFVINLVAMRYCEENCENGAWRIAKVTTEDIFFDDRANVLSFVRRENNIFHQRIDDRGKVSDLDGQCHKEKFSGMPPETKLRN